ncbi:flagellar biosynthetic protein FliO [Alkalihalophilus lindianensis]|uniref:Flagellar protein n=1 Tax=Alkalihalophilus lindianensis TaxID=1630542 RepID=A0ABU3XC29_9BACI|nr:flagellar biosynthetic protein FliO [Alkalihalophilus lindianensis]MDV2685441.1 flagellar biosynthetic protein FliO [Alkalihalophilus lindianensis]
MSNHFKLIVFLKRLRKRLAKVLSKVSGVSPYMCKPVVAALMLSFFFVFGWSNQISAEGEGENRTVSEAIEEGEQSPENEQTVLEEETTDLVESPNTEEELAVPMTDQNPFLMFIQMMSALAFVVFLIYMLLRFVNKRSQSYQSTKLMQNMGGVPLGANRSVQLVKVGDRLLVVGVGDSIQLLKELDDPREIERFIELQEKQFEQIDQPLSSLLGKMNGLLNRNEKSSSKANENEEAFKALLGKQLKEVSTSQKQIQDEVRERDK